MANAISLKVLVEIANKELQYDKALAQLLQEDEEFIINIFYNKFAKSLGNYVATNYEDSQKIAYVEMLKIYQENVEKIKKITQFLINDNYSFLFNGKRFFSPVEIPPLGEQSGIKRSKSNWTYRLHTATNFASQMGNPDTSRSERPASPGFPGTSGVIFFTPNVPKEKVILDVDNFKAFWRYVSGQNNVPPKIKDINQLAIRNLYRDDDSGGGDTEESEIITVPIDDVRILAYYKVTFDQQTKKVVVDTNGLDINDFEGTNAKDAFKFIAEKTTPFIQEKIDSVNMFGKSFVPLDIKLTEKEVSQWSPEFTKEEREEIRQKYWKENIDNDAAWKQKKIDDEIMGKSENMMSSVGRFLVILKNLKTEEAEKVKNAKSKEEFSNAIWDGFLGKDSSASSNKNDIMSRFYEKADAVIASSFQEFGLKHKNDYSDQDEAAIGFIKYLESTYFENIKYLITPDTLGRTRMWTAFTKPKSKVTPPPSPSQSDEPWKRYLPSFRSKEWNKNKSDEQLKPAILAWLAKQPKKSP